MRPACCTMWVWLTVPGTFFFDEQTLLDVQLSVTLTDVFSFYCYTSYYVKAPFVAVRRTFFTCCCSVWHFLCVCRSVVGSHQSYKPWMAPNSLFCADVPLRNYSVTHSLLSLDLCSSDRRKAMHVLVSQLPAISPPGLNIINAYTVRFRTETLS